VLHVFGTGPQNLNGRDAAAAYVGKFRLYREIPEAQPAFCPFFRIHGTPGERTGRPVRARFRLTCARAEPRIAACGAPRRPRYENEETPEWPDADSAADWTR
jgi:hypothetical protein